MEVRKPRVVWVGTAALLVVALLSPLSLAQSMSCAVIPVPVAIPDSPGAAATQTFTVPAGGVITDLDVSVEVRHTWVGDLVITITHVTTGTSVIIMDRPGVPASTFGCANSDVVCRFDDASAVLVETMCGGGPAIGPVARPQSPLSAFNGEGIGGDWRISVQDFAGGDVGTINNWCLIYVAGPPMPTCSVMAPPGTTSGPVNLSVMTTSAAMPPNVTVSVEWSPAGMMAFLPCTMTPASPNPNPLVAAPAGAHGFQWDAAADGAGTMAMQNVDVRVTVIDSVGMGTCTVTFNVDNRISCMIMAPGGTVMGPVNVTVTTATTSMPPTVNVALEWSPAGMGAFASCTMTVSSPNPNPVVGAPSGMFGFQWNAGADGAGSAAPASIDLRATVSDAGGMSTCITTVMVDNTSLCTTICGDCNISGAGPDIIDALTAAQIAAGLTIASMAQMGCCDVDSSMAVTVLDALVMAQSAAGLPAMPSCP